MRSSARLTQQSNDSYEDNEPERDLGSTSRDGSRSPWDAPSPVQQTYNNNANHTATNTSGSHGHSSSQSLGASGRGGAPRNSRGFVQDMPTPSLSAAVSSLFSSVSPAYSRGPPWNRSDTVSSTNYADYGLAPGSSRTVQEAGEATAESDGSNALSLKTPPASSIALPMFRIAKQRKSDEIDRADGSFVTPGRLSLGGSSWTSPSQTNGVLRPEAEQARFSPASSAAFREDGTSLQRRFSAPTSPNVILGQGNGTEDSQVDTLSGRDDRSHSSAAYY